MHAPLAHVAGVGRRSRLRGADGDGARAIPAMPSTSTETETIRQCQVAPVGVEFQRELREEEESKGEIIMNSSIH